MGSILILGATSSIGRAVAAEFAANGYGLALTARDAAELERVAADLGLRYGVPVTAFPLDLLIPENHKTVLDSCFSLKGNEIEGAVFCIGAPGESHTAEADPAEARHVLEINFTACVPLLDLLAEYFKKKRSGYLCVVSSVAGDRGRQSNYHYGAAKAGLSAYLQGLRNRLHPAGVAVITVKPGFVDSRMTFGRKGLFLVASPEKVARGIYKSIGKRRNVVYLPGFWRPIMFLVRLIPEWIFKRLRT